jgi:uncharacterized protein (TIGR00297 family)
MRIALQLGLGLLLSGAIAFTGYRKAALSRSGVVGAVLVGTTIFGLGGWAWGMVLIAFFVLSSALSFYKKGVKEAMAEKFAKGSQRDLGQALANGGMGALITLALPFAKGGVPLLLAAFVGAMATVNADTWATELGVLSPRPPRLITTGRVVERGTSGGVTLLGTLATVGGGAVIGLSMALFLSIDGALGGPGTTQAGVGTAPAMLLLTLVGAVGGWAGSLCDSFLGATVQAIYYSKGRKKETERIVDPDGTPNEHLRGWPWLNNDWVNFISSGVGALVSLLTWWAILY